ncbi:metal ABC transporter solute-binding protein, Zn/Mn family [Spirulina subsalsa]|uniref:metal ABC transporter solute-binding protein, Zn/Mn family n=1 Tax=Spirulina subsalsa TaxID=54311 RepID=UPI0002F0390A|nr:zinc ABC transporter substrate-binding protein [Spirulina subsalsa]
MRHLEKLLFCGLLLLSGCNAQPTSDSDKPYVVATSTILADLTQEVARDKIELKSILKPGEDPHVYEPVPQDSIALERADLIFYNGYDLEPALIRLINAAGIRAKKIAVAEQITPLMDEAENLPDPHVWGDAKNGIIMVEVIRDALIELLPGKAENLRQNAQGLIEQLEALDQWILAQIATIPPENRKLVTTHDAFAYYAEAYGLEILGTLIGVSTEEQPSAQTLSQLANEVRGQNIPTVFAETTINPALMDTLAQESGAVLSSQQLYSDSIGAAGSAGDSYINMLVANTTAIVEGLGGTITPFAPN